MSKNFCTRTCTPVVLPGLYPLYVCTFCTALPLYVLALYPRFAVRCRLPKSPVAGSVPQRSCTLQKFLLYGPAHLYPPLYVLRSTRHERFPTTDVLYERTGSLPAGYVRTCTRCSSRPKARAFAGARAALYARLPLPRAFVRRARCRAREQFAPRARCARASSHRACTFCAHRFARTRARML